jgi:integrase
MPGEGSIYRRASDGRWVATISIGRRGERRISTVYRHSRAEALDALADLRSHAGRVDRKTTVSAYLERWLRDADIRPTTRHGYAAVIATHLGPSIGHIRLAALTPLDVRTMMAGLSGSSKTRRNVLVVLRRALREAVRAELVSRNVASPEYIDAPKVPATEPDALTVDEIARILAALPGDPIANHVVVALCTGLRQGEQLGLAWQDIRPDGIHVEFELARIDGRYRRVEPKTERSRRVVPAPTAVSAALDRQRDSLIAAGFVPIATGPVFVNAEGAELSGSVLTHRWYRLLERAGVRRRPWKILRATYGSRLHAQGVDELTIAALMGHARTHTTRKHYLAAPSLDATAAIEAILTDTVTVTAASVGVSRGQAR